MTPAPPPTAPPPPRTGRSSAPWVALAAALAAVAASGLTDRSFGGAFEGWALEVSREQYAAGALFRVPTLAGMPFVEKPPLFFDIVAGAFALSGGPSVAAAFVDNSLGRFVGFRFDIAGTGDLPYGDVNEPSESWFYLARVGSLAGPALLAAAWWFRGGWRGAFRGRGRRGRAASLALCFALVPPVLGARGGLEEEPEIPRLGRWLRAEVGDRPLAMVGWGDADLGGLSFAMDRTILPLQGVEEAVAFLDRPGPAFCLLGRRARKRYPGPPVEPPGAAVFARPRADGRRYTLLANGPALAETPEAASAPPPSRHGEAEGPEGE